MAKAWQFYDAAGALRNVKSAKLYAADGTLHNIKQGLFYDAGGVLRTFFQPTNKLVTFTTGNLNTSGLSTNAVYGIGARTVLAAQSMAAGGGQPVGTASALSGNLTTPGSTALPFPLAYAADLMMVANINSGFEAGSTTGTTWPSTWFFFTTAWVRPLVNSVYFLCRFADYSPQENLRTACFGSVDFEDGVGPRTADTATFQQFGEQFYVANYSNYGLWSWPKGAGGYPSTGLARSLQFSGAPAQLQGWTWTQSGATGGKTIYVNGTTVLTLSGSLYAPVGSPYLSAGRGTLLLSAGVAPAGMGVQAIHWSNTSGSAVCHVFTDETAAWQKMPKMQVRFQIPGVIPLLTSVGPWSASSGGAALGWVYSFAPISAPATSGNVLVFE